MTLNPGTRLGPYEITGAIGAGGMGEVYKAKDSRLGRDVAIKVLPTSFADDPDRRARFEREAQAVAALSHPNVIAIFDTGVFEDQLYVVMELLTGQTLRERLSAGPIPVRKAVDTAIQIARGLGAAHGKGIVHRDLKPENIFLIDDGQVKILDFGLARQAAETVHSGATQTMAMTGAGTVMGTVGYMAPEQVRGLVVDARADVFAFGAVLYEMVSGQRAFQRDTAADTMTAILTHDPPELTGSRPDLSPALERIIRHCLEKNANERFQNARDIAFALGALSGSATGAASGATAAIAAVEPAPRPRASFVTIAAVAGALVLGAGAGYFGRGPTTSQFAAASAVSYQPVTFEDGFVFLARFAPDGRTIVYSADWDKQPLGVYVTSLDSLEYRLLGFPGSDLLAVSRSGELAVLGGSTITGGNPYWRIGSLARGTLTGGSSRAELEGVRFADFGSDGAMAAVRDLESRSTMEYPVGQVIAEGSLVGYRGAFAAPRLSPSGELASFDVQVPSAITVKVFNKSGKLVTESRKFNDWWGLAWTPANEIWFAAAEASGSQTGIFSLDLTGKERTIWRAPGTITLHDISAKGDVLVSFDRGSARTELLAGPQSSPVDRSWREESHLAAISTNHTLLISGVGDSAGPAGSVYAWSPDDTQPVRIADGFGLAISPDGKKALVAASEASHRITVVPTGAGQPQVLDIGEVDSVSWAGWLPDGRLVFQAGRNGADATVSVIGKAGGAPVALLPAGVALRGAGQNLISPDGSLIAAVDKQSRWLVCTITTPAACRPIPGAESTDNVAGWSADAKSVVTYRREPGTARVDRLDITNGRRTAIITIRPIQTALSGLFSVIATPDGALAYTYHRAASQLYVIKGLK